MSGNLSSGNGQQVSASPLENLTRFVEGVEAAIALASNNEDAALAAIAEVEHRLVAYLKECAVSAIGSGSSFNQGVVRGLEIAAAQVEHGHYQRRNDLDASVDRSGEAGETAQTGSTEGESAVTNEDSADAQ